MIQFTIVIPTFNRPDQAARCLAALAAGEFAPEQFEVVMVDDGSRARYAEHITPFGQKMNVTLLHQENAGPSAARNMGAHHAKGKFLAFLDDDCAPSPGWLKNLADVFASDPDCLAGGRNVNGSPENPYCEAGQFIEDAIYSTYESNPRKVFFFASNNMALPRVGFAAAGGFDTRFRGVGAEDREFCDRWRRRGGRMRYAPRAVVFHSPKLDGKLFLRKYFNYGRGDFHYARSPFRREAGLAAQTLGHYSRIISHFFKVLPRLKLRDLFRLPCLLAAWQGSLLAGYVWEARLFFLGSPGLRSPSGEASR